MRFQRSEYFGQNAFSILSTKITDCFDWGRVKIIRACSNFIANQIGDPPNNHFAKTVTAILLVIDCRTISASTALALRFVLLTISRVGRSDELPPHRFDLHLLSFCNHVHPDHQAFVHAGRKHNHAEV